MRIESIVASLAAVALLGAAPAAPRWSRGPVLPVPRTEVQVATLGPRVFVLGGDNGREGRQEPSHDDVFVYDLAAGSWSRAGRLPYGVHGTGDNRPFFH